MPCTELFRTIRAVATAFLSPNDLTTPASSIAPRVDTEQAPGKHIATDETPNDCYSLLSTNCMQIIFIGRNVHRLLPNVSTSKGNRQQHFAVPSNT